jgi:hypothetical protein
MTIEKNSYTGQEYIDLVGTDPATLQRLTDLFALFGATADDISLASGRGFADEDYVSIEVMQVDGAEAALLVQQTIQNTIDTAPLFNPGMSASSAPATVGGKEVAVLTVLIGSSVYQTSYIYGYGDAVFTIQAGEEATVADALSQLP